MFPPRLPNSGGFVCLPPSSGSNIGLNFQNPLGQNPLGFGLRSPQSQSGNYCPQSQNIASQSEITAGNHGHRLSHQPSHGSSTSGTLSRVETNPSLHTVNGVPQNVVVQNDGSITQGNTNGNDGGIMQGNAIQGNDGATVTTHHGATVTAHRLVGDKTRRFGIVYQHRTTF